MKVVKIIIAMLIVSVVASWMFSYPSSKAQSAGKEVGFCTNCHEMQPNYYTWQVTSHNKFGCLKCHQDIKITTFAYKHLRGAAAIKFPIEKKRIIPNDICQSCHTNNRSVSPPGDIIFPHQLHVVKQIDCVDCHGNVTHLGIAEYLKDPKNGSTTAFTPVQAQKLVVKDNQILMSVCMRCHNGDMATAACNACHKNQKTSGKIAIKQ